ncbi:MAG: hypothetical protein HWD60_00150 [Defluviicoccus sp.]|nr:MAG: hypothetical protein HWD60_00150 [Defluviicoccus sp.]
MPARQSFYAEDLAEHSTTSTDWPTTLSLSFTPEAGAVYWLLFSAALGNSSGVDDHVGQVEVYHVEADTTLISQSMQRQEASSPPDWLAVFGIARLSFGAAPGAPKLEVNIRSSHAGDTTKIKDARLLLIRADATDAYAESLAQVNTGSTGWQTAATLTLTPASPGDYLLIASATRASDANLGAMRCRLDDVTGGTTYGDRAWYSKDDWDNQPFAVMQKLSLGAAARTLQLQYRSESGTLCYLRDARILALRLDAFDSAYVASNYATQSTTAADDQDLLTLSATPLALQHAVIAVGAYNTVSTGVSGSLSVARDGSTIAEWNREAPNAAGWQCAGLVQRAALSAVATTWTWRARAEAAGTPVNVGDLAITVLQLEATPLRRGGGAWELWRRHSG